jgi:hypothetical protein
VLEDPGEEASPGQAVGALDRGCCSRSVLFTGAGVVLSRFVLLRSGHDEVSVGGVGGQHAVVADAVESGGDEGGELFDQLQG